MKLTETYLANKVIGEEKHRSAWLKEQEEVVISVFHFVTCVGEAAPLWLVDDGLTEDINAGVTGGEERKLHGWLVKSIPEDHNLLWMDVKCYSRQWSTRWPLAGTASPPDLPQLTAHSHYSACHQEGDLLPPGNHCAAWSSQLQEPIRICQPQWQNLPRPFVSAKCWTLRGMRWCEVKVVEVVDGVAIKSLQTTKAAGRRSIRETWQECSCRSCPP